MTSGLFSLLKTRRFAPLLATQFLGAFNDNLLKNSMMIAMIYGTALKSGLDEKIMVTLAAGFFILPYVLFSAFAGQLADKKEKAGLVRAVKWAELALMLTAAAGFMLGSAGLLMAVLFLMGTQSAFFSPLKYSLLPDHLQPDEILGGNALLEASTFLSILTGTIAGGLLIAQPEGEMLVYTTLILLSLVGLTASYRIPPSGPFEPGLRLNPNFIGETFHLLKRTFRHRIIALAILGISWFWLVGAVFFSQFPAFTKTVLGGDEEVVTLLLTAFSIGIALGSLLIHRLLRGVISTKYMVAGLLGMSLFAFDLFLASPAAPPSETLQNAAAFLQEGRNLRILFDLVMIAVSGGVYIVPLNAILQTHTPAQERARTIAANNIMNALFMTLASGGTAALLALEVSIPAIFLLVALFNLAVAAAYIITARFRPWP